MKIQSHSLLIATPLFLSSLQSCQAFAPIPIHHHHQPEVTTAQIRNRQKDRQGRGRGGSSSSSSSSSSRHHSRLYIASLRRTDTQTSNDNSSNNNNNNNNDGNSFTSTYQSSKIDNELSAQNPDPKSSSSASILSEMHSILDDGNGHINQELATSIWTWENENLQPLDSDPFPLASKLKYSTRDGLRLIETIAREMEMDGNGNGIDHSYSDLVQEGVVALMKCMVIWEEDSQEETLKGDDNKFESFASREIRKSMRKVLRETSDGVGVMKMNLDLLKKNVEDLDRERKEGTSTGTDMDTTKEETSKESRSRINNNVSQPCDQLVEPLREAVLDENPTPDEIALSEMIRHDIGDFLERTLNVEELKVIRMRFGLVEVGTSLEDIALNLGKPLRAVQDIEEAALRKLRTCFSNDYIGVYLDDDNTEEVSL